MPEKNQQTIKKNNNNSNKKKKPKKMKKSTIKKISAVVILIAVLATVLYFAFKTLKPQGAIATINGEIITKQELDQKYSQLPEQYQLFITKEDFLDQMINVKLLLQEAKKQAIVISEEEIEFELNNLKKQTSTEEEFNELLKQRNIELEDLRKQINEQLTINKLLNETVFSKIEISDSKIKQYYEANPDSFEAKEGEIRIKHILVTTEEAAEQLLEDLEEGADFSELAQLQSLDTASAIRGGELGFISRGQMVKEFEDAAFALAVNQVSSITQTQFGYHIIKREPGIISYDEAEDQIEQILFTDISNNAIEIYISQLSSDATIIKEGTETPAEEEIEIITEDKKEEEIITEEDIEILADIETFTETDDNICKEDNKVIIRLFSTTKNKASNWISETFDNLAEESDDIIIYHWQLDTGDNAITDIEETGIPKEEVQIFKKYSKENKVPAYVLGCKYVRIGNAYETLEEEKAEFKRAIEQLIS